jgi:hypothetical protein
MSALRSSASACFPHHAPQSVTETVYSTHARLRENATANAHLAALTQRQVGDELACTLPGVAYNRRNLTRRQRSC